jgi:hypothetical protein
MHVATMSDSEPELTEPMRQAVQLPLPPAPVAQTSLPPLARVKRTSSIKTMLIPLLRITGVHRAVPDGARTDRVAADRVPTDKEFLAVESGAHRSAPLRPLLWGLVGASGAALAVAALLAPKFTHRADKGFLVVNASQAQATVTLDGQLQSGSVPLVIQLPAGLHQVDVEAPGFAIYHAEVVVEAGSQETIDAELVLGGK